MAVQLKAKKEVEKRARAPKKVKVKAKVQNMVFLTDEHKTSDEQKFGANVMFKKFEGMKKFNYFGYARKPGDPEEYASYTSDFFIKKGRATYRVALIHFFIKGKGVKYRVQFLYYNLKGATNRIEFLDNEIKLKRNMEFSEDVPFMVPRKRYSYEKQTTVDVYIPMRYLEEMGYKEVEEVEEKKDLAKRVIRRKLVTPHFTETIEKREEEDFEEQKRLLLEALKTAKSRYDVVQAVHKHTDLTIPDWDSFKNSVF